MELRTMGDVRLAANDCGMTVEQYFAESAPEELERVDWNDERPSDGYLGERLQILNEQIEQLERERRILRKWGCAVPSELDEWLSDLSKRWTELFWLKSE